MAKQQRVDRAMGWLLDHMPYRVALLVVALAWWATLMLVFALTILIAHYI